MSVVSGFVLERNLRVLSPETRPSGLHCVIYHAEGPARQEP